MRLMLCFALLCLLAFYALHFIEYSYKNIIDETDDYCQVTLLCVLYKYKVCTYCKLN